jgi:hypothetical protein
MKSTADASVYLVGFKLETAQSLIARKEIFYTLISSIKPALGYGNRCALSKG